MNKYKLINKQTAEEHLCERVVIDGWDYYVTNKEYFKHNDLNVPSDFSKVSDITITKIPDLDIVNDSRNGYNKVIATNNPSIDIPKVVDKDEKVALMAIRSSKKFASKSESDYTLGFIAGYKESQEIHPNSDDDMIEFGNWLSKEYNISNGIGWWHSHESIEDISTKELLQLWKEQRTKTLYYE